MLFSARFHPKAIPFGSISPRILQKNKRKLVFKITFGSLSQIIVILFVYEAIVFSLNRYFGREISRIGDSRVCQSCKSQSSQRSDPFVPFVLRLSHKCSDVYPTQEQSPAIGWVQHLCSLAIARRADWQWLHSLDSPEPRLPEWLSICALSKSTCTAIQYWRSSSGTFRQFSTLKSNRFYVTVFTSKSSNRSTDRSTDWVRAWIA